MSHEAVHNIILFIFQENDDLVKYLLAHGADIEVKANDGISVLHEAARSGNNDVRYCVHYILAYQINISHTHR